MFSFSFMRSYWLLIALFILIECFIILERIRPAFITLPYIYFLLRHAFYLRNIQPRDSKPIGSNQLLSPCNGVFKGIECINPLPTTTPSNKTSLPTNNLSNGVSLPSSNKLSNGVSLPSSNKLSSETQLISVPSLSDFTYATSLHNPNLFKIKGYYGIHSPLNAQVVQSYTVNGYGWLRKLLGLYFSNTLPRSTICILKNNDGYLAIIANTGFVGFSNQPLLKTGTIVKQGDYLFSGFGEITLLTQLNLSTIIEYNSIVEVGTTVIGEIK